MADRLQCALQAIDAANGRDPTDEAGQPAEFLYGRRMSEALAALRATCAIEVALGTVVVALVSVFALLDPR